MVGIANDFNKIIQDGRERKKNEALASKIFSKSRRQSAPGNLKRGAGPSLASRVGVKKNVPQRTIATNRRASVPSGNVDGEWTHDLHHTVTGQANSLRSRITNPKAATVASTRQMTKKQARIASAFNKMDVDGDLDRQINMLKRNPSSNGPNLTIKGLAGPFTVMGQNFAPGTTPADVESAMTPVGGEMISCTLVKSQPFVVMEMVFASREGGEKVIETFNDKTADGRLIKVYPKVGGGGSSVLSASLNGVPTGPRASRNGTRGQVINGSMGFSTNNPGLTANTRNAAGNGYLVSDRMIAPNRRAHRK